MSKYINQRKSQLYCPDKVLCESKLSKLSDNLSTKILIVFAKLTNGVAGSVWVTVASPLRFKGVCNRGLALGTAVEHLCGSQNLWSLGGNNYGSQDLLG